MSEDQHAPASTQSDSTSETSVTQAMPEIGKLLVMGPRLQATMLKTVIDRQRQALALLNQRTADGLKLAEAISDASSPTDALEAWTAFVQTGFKHVAEHAGEIGRQTMEALQTAQREAAATSMRRAA